MTTSLPYPGLRPFLRSETDIFFGREEHTDDLLEILSRSHFLAVLGPSGCGKSSLVRAGMLPSLETGFMASAGARWRVAEMRPGDHPLKRLAAALMTDSALGPERRGESDAAAFLYATLRRGPLGLIEALRETPLPNRTNLLVFVDQFEEIFRFRDRGASNRDETDAFVAMMLDTAAQREVPVYVALTMRSDYLGHCAVFAGLPEAMNKSQYLTPRLTREQRDLAIVGPARVFGADIDRAVVNRLLNDMGPDPNQLPLMQHVLMRMWQGEGAGVQGFTESYDRRPTITVTDYEATGGLAKALSNHADKAWDELDDDEERRIAEVLFRCLSERGPDQRDTRRPTPLQDVAAVARVSCETVEKVVEAFRRPDRSFVTPPAGERLYPTTRLDISHESLISNWRRLDEWAQAETKSAETYRLLEQTARRWKAGQTALWGTPDLEHALSWKATEGPTPEWAARYGHHFGLALEFLAESERKARIDQAAAEALHQREVQEARERAEEERQRADQEIQTSRRLRGLSWALGAAMVLGLGTSVVAVWQWTLADEQRILANGRAVAASQAETRAREAARTIREALSVAETQAQQIQQADQTILRIERQKADEQRDLAHKADDARRLAEVRALVGNANGNLERDPELSALLALQALPIAGTAYASEVVETLHRTLRAPRPILTLTSHDGAVSGIAFSRDGSRLVTASWDGTARIWDVESGKELRVLDDGSSLWSADFSPDGSRVVTASQDGRPALWDAHSGALIDTLDDHDDSVYRVVFSPDGRTLASAAADNTAKIWDTATTNVVLTLSGHTDDVRDVAFSSDGMRVATASTDNTARVWHAGTGIELLRLQHGNQVRTVAFSQDGKSLITGSWDFSAAVWDLATGRKTRTLPDSTSPVLGIAINDRHVAIARMDSSARVLDLDSGDTTSLAGHKGQINGIVFSPDGRRVATASSDRTAKVWDLAPSELPALGSDRVRRVAFSPNGTQFAAGTTDGKIQLIDAEDGAVLFSDDAEHQSEITGLEFSRDGERLLTSDIDGTVMVWSTQSRTRLFPLANDKAPVYAVAFGPTLMATGDRDGQVKVWDLQGRLVRTIPAHKERVTSVAFRRDGRQIASASWDDTARLFDVSSGVMLREFPHQEAVFRVAFSPDDSRLVTTSQDGIAQIWDADTDARKPVSLVGHAFVPQGVSFSPDGTLVASAGMDNTVRIWNPGTGDLILTIPTGSDGFWDLAFMPSGKGLVATGLNGAQRFTLDVSELGALALTRLTRSLTLDECRQYLGIDACPTTAASHIVEGKRLAAAADRAAALFSFRMAQEQLPNVTFDPEREVNRILSRSLLAEAKHLAGNFDIDGAKVTFTRQQEFDSNSKTDPKVQAEKGVAERYIQAAEGHIRAGDLDDGLAAYRDALRIDPSEKFDPRRRAAEFLLAEAERSAANSTTDRAIEQLKLAISLDPLFVQAHERLGLVHRERQEVEGQVASFTKAAELTPRAYVYAELAETFRLAKEYDLALQNARRGLDRDQDNWYARLVLANIYRDMKDYDRSIAELARAREGVSNDILRDATNLEFSEVYYRMGEFERSLEFAIESASADLPAASRAYRSDGLPAVSRAYHELRRDADAWADHLAHLEENPADEAALASLGFLYHEYVFRFPEAYRTFQRVVRLNPNPGYLQNLAEASLTAGEFEVAYDLASKLMDRLDTPPSQRLAMRFVKFASLLARENWRDAANEYAALMADYRSMSGPLETSWNFDGVEHFLKTTRAIQDSDRVLLTGMIEALRSSGAQGLTRLAQLASSAEEIARR